MLQWIWKSRYLLEILISFSLEMYPKELLDHMVRCVLSKCFLPVCYLSSRSFDIIFQRICFLILMMSNLSSFFIKLDFWHCIAFVLIERLMYFSEGTCFVIDPFMLIDVYCGLIKTICVDSIILIKMFLSVGYM